MKTKLIDHLKFSFYNNCPIASKEAVRKRETLENCQSRILYIILLPAKNYSELFIIQYVNDLMVFEENSRKKEV
jgi:hypothetical protein